VPPDSALESELLPGEVHLWRIALDLSPAQLAELAGVLSPEEQERARRFHFRQDRNRFIAARGRLRTVLGGYAGIAPEQIRFQYSARGKPSLAGTGRDVRFNLAHSRDLALLAVTLQREVGVDVEFIRPEPQEDKLAEHFFSPRETTALRSLPVADQPRAFFNCWTRKEAFLKAMGEGLPFGLNRFTVSLRPGEPAALLEAPAEAGDVSRWSLRHLEPAPGCVGAVAVAGPLEHITFFTT